MKLILRYNQSVSCTEVTKIGKIVSFVNFVRIASPCVGLYLSTLHGYFSYQDFWLNLNFPLEHQMKLVLIFKPFL